MLDTTRCWPSVQRAGVHSAACWGTQCKVLRCTVQHTEVHSSACWGAQCSVLRYTVKGAEVHCAAYWGAQCSVLRSIEQRAGVDKATCWVVQCSMLRCTGSVLRCTEECAEMHWAACWVVQCSVRRCTVQRAEIHCAHNRRRMWPDVVVLHAAGQVQLRDRVMIMHRRVNCNPGTVKTVVAIHINLEFTRWIDKKHRVMLIKNFSIFYGTKTNDLEHFI